MARLLMRSAMSPLVAETAENVLLKNMIGNNMGNMLFPFSIYRALLTENVQIDTVSTARKFTKQDVAIIQDKYDGMIFPFANAFRKSFIPELKRTTDLIRRLTMPCTVIGIGWQGSLQGENKDEELDESVQQFMNAVLDKSTLVGVRGERTAEYLKSLGYIPEKHFTVIGCPSMYLYGKHLPQMKVTALTKNSKVSLNSKISLPKVYQEFMDRSRREFKDYIYVPQVTEEIFRMYAGMPYSDKFSKNRPSGYPITMKNDIYKKDKARSFVNVPSWLAYLSERDFSFGSRIHGNIAAILAGTPCYVLVSDCRIKELVDYHNIPHTMISDLTETTSIFQLHEQADFSKIKQGHEARFAHYLDFLGKNNVKTIYDKNGEAKECLFDQKIAETEFDAGLHAFSAVDLEEQNRRLEKILGWYRDISSQTRSKMKPMVIKPDGKKYSLGRTGSVEKWKEGVKEIVKK